MLDVHDYQAIGIAMIEAEIRKIMASGMKIPKTDLGVGTLQCAAHRGYTNFYNSLTMAEIDELGVRRPTLVKPYEIVTVD